MLSGQPAAGKRRAGPAPRGRGTEAGDGAQPGSRRPGHPWRSVLAVRTPVIIAATCGPVLAAAAVLAVALARPGGPAPAEPGHRAAPLRPGGRHRRAQPGPGISSWAAAVCSAGAFRAAASRRTGPRGAGRSAGPDCAATAVAASRAWLASGIIPGDSAVLRSMAERSLLDLYLSVQPDGAVVAGYYHGWDYAWPRDSSWVAAALAETGHGADALRVLPLPGPGAERQRHLGRALSDQRQRPGSGRPAGRAGRGGLGAVGGVVLVPGRWHWHWGWRWHWVRGPHGTGRAVANGQRRGRGGRAVADPQRPARAGHRLLGARQPGDAGHRRSPADRVAGGGGYRDRARPRPRPAHGGRRPRADWPRPCRRRSAVTATTDCPATRRPGRRDHLARPPVRPGQPGPGTRRTSRPAGARTAQRRPSARYRLAGEPDHGLDPGDRVLRPVGRGNGPARRGRHPAWTGWPRTAPRSASYPSRSTPTAGRARWPRWPGPTPPCC